MCSPARRTCLFVCLDCYNDGNIAICFTNQIIEVYNNDGEFLYEISFYIEYGNYGIMWHDDNILIMSGIGYTAIEISPEGSIVDVISVHHDNSQGNKWSQYVLASGNYIYDGYVYNKKMEQGFFSREVTSYITKKSLKTGEETVIIEFKTKNDAPFFWFVCFPFCCIFVLSLSLFFKKKASQNKFTS